MKKSRVQEQKNRLEHILQAIVQIEGFVKGCDKKSFCTTSLLNNAVLYNFSIIGEAIAHIDDEILNKHPYPWYKVRAFSNLIAHEVFNIKMEAVWMIIKNELPNLKKNIKAILSTEFRTL